VAKGVIMKVGDLVAPQFWCKDKGRIAIVVQGVFFGEVIIQYLDEPSWRTNARMTNLEVISEAKT
jgi:hypothetical protein